MKTTAISSSPSATSSETRLARLAIAVVNVVVNVVVDVDADARNARDPSYDHVHDDDHVHDGWFDPPPLDRLALNG